MSGRSSNQLLKFDAVLSAAALALSAACTMAWLIGWHLAEDAWFSRGAIFICSVIVSGGLLHVLLTRIGRQEDEARRYLEQLCRRDEFGHVVSSPGDLPPLNPRSPWCEILNRVEGRFTAAAERGAELEQARSAWELRCRRASGEYERLSKILSGLPEPVFAVNEFDEIWLTNPSAEQLLGLEAEAGQKRLLSRLERCERLIGLLHDTRRRKVPTTRTDELELAGPDGGRHWYRVSVTSLPNGAAAPAATESSADGVVAVLRDISTQKAAQRNNAEFVSSASHEMKTPLAGIKAYVELLADGDAEDEETREEFLKVINGQADRLQRLIDNLLNLARIEAGVVQVSKQPQSLNDLLQEAINVCQPSAEAKSIQLVAELSTMYLGVLVDRDMMLQAAINLLSNAIKYTAPGGKVTLRSRLLGDEVQFEVEDTGVGLSETDCQRVFEKFYRVEKNKGMAQGTGLGLPLAKYIVEDVHGGRLGLTSKLDVGSTFSVVVPAAARSAN